MIRVKSRCWRCGEVNLSLEDILLVEHGDGDGTFYTFICGLCGEAQAYPADGRFVDFMRMNGSGPVVLTPPIEYKEARGEPPLSWDDLLDLHLLLEDQAP
ncbi:MAG: hypothetical protein H5T74_06905 [Actinobacteria bacterium]|nr:hypothetical protein [Actinomycetota bacterium]MDI6829840.1 hypothetical protein [Actinomycetota bacterium]